MTVEKAVEILKANNEKRVAAIYASCKRLAIEALEKQIPKEPLKKSTEYNGEYGYCPCCNSILAEYADFKRCRECGQALKW
jgi:hypothetical protein